MSYPPNMPLCKRCNRPTFMCWCGFPLITQEHNRRASAHTTDMCDWCALCGEWHHTRVPCPTEPAGVVFVAHPAPALQSALIPDPAQQKACFLSDPPIRRSRRNKKHAFCLIRRSADPAATKSMLFVGGLS